MCFFFVFFRVDAARRFDTMVQVIQSNWRIWDKIGSRWINCGSQLSALSVANSFFPSFSLLSRFSWIVVYISYLSENRAVFRLFFIHSHSFSSLSHSPSFSFLIHSLFFSFPYSLSFHLFSLYTLLFSPPSSIPISSLPFSAHKPSRIWRGSRRGGAGYRVATCSESR